MKGDWAVPTGNWRLHRAECRHAPEVMSHTLSGLEDEHVLAHAIVNGLSFCQRCGEDLETQRFILTRKINRPERVALIQRFGYQVPPAWLKPLTPTERAVLSPKRSMAWTIPVHGHGDWEHIATRYEEEIPGADPESIEVLASICRSVKESGLPLYGFTSLLDLMVTDTLLTEVPYEVLRVSTIGGWHGAPDHPGEQIRITHFAHNGHNDSVQRPLDEGQALFWRFVKEKFGMERTG